MSNLPIIKQPIYDSFRSFFPTEEAFHDFLREGWDQLERENPLLIKFICEQVRLIDGLTGSHNYDAKLAIMAVLALVNHQINNRSFGQPTIVSGRTPFLR